MRRVQKKLVMPKEIEFKYLAKHISSLEFCRLCTTRKLGEPKVVSGADVFYAGKNKSEFMRYRTGSDINQLTLKRKLNKANNYVRIEHNLNLNRETSVFQVACLCQDLGFSYNMTLYKRAFIYESDTHTLVFYTVSRSEHDLSDYLGSFIEIEMSETFPWNSTKAALSELKKLEKKYSFLGTHRSKRVKKSLWEMFKKG